MSIRQGKKLIASSTTNGFNLFDCKWADHILNNISWLRADTFSWQSGDVYVAAYNHLVADCENAQTTAYYAWTGEGFIAGTQETVYTTSQVPSIGDTVYYYDSNGLIRFGTVKTVSSANITFTYIVGGETSSSMAYGGEVQLPVHMETVAGVTITYCLSQDGHKICTPGQESNIIALYEATGVAWYYILDTTNRQFKLPRTKWGFTGIRSGVGEYVEQDVLLPNITGSFNTNSPSSSSVSGAFKHTGSWNSHGWDGTHGSGGKTYAIDASRSSSVYSGNGTNTLIQPRGTQMYLYFYVGNFVEDITTIDAGKLAEVVNDFDIDTFKPQVDEAKNSAITGISDAKTDAIGSLTNLATDLGTSLKYGNVGDIFYTSRLDVSLNGAVECNGNLYNTTDFSGAQSIGNLLRDSKVPYISLAEHQTTVDTYGSCRCFGWDGGTEFRVPKLADVFIEAGIAASEGEFITAGLPDHNHKIIINTKWGSKNANNGPNWCGDDATRATNIAATSTNASASNPIYGNSDTVQPPAVRYRAMVQLAFGATDDAVVTAGNVVADVSELNAHKVIAFQAPTASNGYKWYRKYADGWVEQGVINVEIGTAIYTFNFPVIMQNTNYTVMASVSDVLNTTSMAAKHSSKATTGVNVRCTYQASSIHGDIMVCGVAA